MIEIASRCEQITTISDLIDLISPWSNHKAIPSVLAAHTNTHRDECPLPISAASKYPPSPYRALQQHHMCVDTGSTWMPLCRWLGPSVRSFLSNDNINININMDNQDPATSLAAAVAAAARLVAADACPAAA